jgi:hypothetical protein
MVASLALDILCLGLLVVNAENLNIEAVELVGVLSALVSPVVSNCQSAIFIIIIIIAFSSSLSLSVFSITAS